MAKLHLDPVQSARSIDLVYITDAAAGIQRHRRGKAFSYTYKEKRVSDKAIIARIRKLAIPPAWQNVWICWQENGHIQATGFDARNRKQYRYHPMWSELRRETKFQHLLDFGRQLPALRLQLEKDVASRELNEKKVVATVISLMERSYIRIGNEKYEKENGSFGLTTLKDQHVAVEGGTVKFAFKGKKGIFHNITLKNKKLAKIVKECRDIPGKELFQYYDQNGQRQSIDSGMVNRYIKEVAGDAFSAKDFRTWAGSLAMLRAFHSMEKAIAEKERKSNVLKALDAVSLQLGNTRTVCRKYYVHPGIIEKYTASQLDKYLSQLNDIEKNDNKSGYTQEEALLLKILGG